jgi:hypothetical protein
MNVNSYRLSASRHRLRNEVFRSLSTDTQIVEAIYADSPLASVLNHICAGLDCEIGNVVSGSSECKEAQQRGF